MYDSTFSNFVICESFVTAGYSNSSTYLGRFLVINSTFNNFFFWGASNRGMFIGINYDFGEYYYQGIAFDNISISNLTTCQIKDTTE